MISWICFVKEVNLVPLAVKSVGFQIKMLVVVTVFYVVDLAVQFIGILVNFVNLPMFI